MVLSPDESIARLKTIGQWMGVNGEAIYATQASPFGLLPWGRCTQKEENGKTILYFSVFDWPTNGKLIVPGLTNQVVKASLLAGGKKIQTTASKEGLVLAVPATAPDAIATVVKVEVKGNVTNHISKGAKKDMKSGALD